MSHNLSAFMAQNAVLPETAKYAASKRFLGEDEKPVEWEICAISADEDDVIRRECTKKTPVPGKKGIFTPELDLNTYNRRLAARCTIHPNLKNTELQNSYGVMGEEALLGKMLLPGELTDYIVKVQEVNGFDVSFEELAEEVKN